jgi:hypothetical protein
MGYRAGDTVIVTTEDKNQVAVVLDRRVINKTSLYDILLESRTALVMLATNSNARNYINKSLTAKLCDTDAIQTTIPYKELVANDLIPHLDANSAGKASW